VARKEKRKDACMVLVGKVKEKPHLEDLDGGII
jgi:hypothetical protein